MAFTETEVDELFGMINEIPLNLCELWSLDGALQTIQHKLKNNLAKLTELDEHIVCEEHTVDEADSVGVKMSIRCRIAERLRNLQDKWAAHQEATSASWEALWSQVNCIWETINPIFPEDTTLASASKESWLHLFSLQ